jgi:predicted O-methyltransferase YrrM
MKGQGFPYDAIDPLPPNPFHWFHAENRGYLETIVRALPVRTVVELGSFLGHSTCAIAGWLPEGGRVFAVDHWLGQPYYPAEVQRIPYFHQFLSNVIHAGRQGVVVPVRMNTLEAAAALKVEADLVYVDAGHTEEEAYADVMAWWPKTRGPAVLCGDDWNLEGVRRGVFRAGSELGLWVRAGTTFWVLSPDDAPSPFLPAVVHPPERGE